MTANTEVTKNRMMSAEETGTRAAGGRPSPRMLSDSGPGEMGRESRGIGCTRESE